MSPDDSALLAGWFLGHPATGPDPQRTARQSADLQALLRDLAAAGRYFRDGVFADADAARAAARLAPGAHAPQALWLPAARRHAVAAEVGDSGIAAVLARGRCAGHCCPDAVVAGHDVLGFGDNLRLTFAREPEGASLCRRLGLPTDPPPFLPDLDTAESVCAALDDEDLGAPVLWVRCWRTVHAAG